MVGPASPGSSRPLTMANKPTTASTTSSTTASTTASTTGNQATNNAGSDEGGWLKTLARWISPPLEFDKNGCITLTDKNFKRITMETCNVLVVFYANVAPAIALANGF
jgi:hypothetical protein